MGRLISEIGRPLVYIVATLPRLLVMCNAGDAACEEMT
jgi:hypothetical protein